MLTPIKAAWRRLFLPGSTNALAVAVDTPENRLIRAVVAYSDVVGRHGPDSEEARNFRERTVGLPEFPRHAAGIDRLKRHFAPTPDDLRRERIRAAAEDLYRELKSLAGRVHAGTYTEGDVAGAYLALDRANGVGEFAPARRPTPAPDPTGEDEKF